MASTHGAGKNGRRILLLSAYDAHSHGQWRETLTTMFPEDQWTCLVLPPRHFSWRIRGNSLSWAFNHRDKLSDNYDLLIATSLVDLSSLRGFVPSLANIPTLVYFHENQFAYPPGSQQHNSVEPQIVNLYTALCADRIAFNSQWNMDSFLDGVTALLNKLPDHVPAGLVERLAQHSSVLPVPLADSLFSRTATRATSSTVDIVWNHRHEYDKGPALLKAIVHELINRKTAFRLHLLGQRFRQQPPEFAEIEALLSEHYGVHGISPGHNNWLPERSDYEAVLRASHIVLSTALHDFQGLSILEAAAMGCRPVAPAALAYPEYLPADCLYPVKGHDLKQQARAAVGTILQQAACKSAVDVSQYSASTLKASWQNALVALVHTENDLSPQGAKG